MQKKSAASQRASAYPQDQSEWYCGFSHIPVTVLGFEEAYTGRPGEGYHSVGAGRG